MAKSERMSSVDTAWLRMERPTNLMMITGVFVFDGSLPFDRLRYTLGERFLTFGRFRQRAVQRLGVAYWEDDPHFDIASHVHRVALPGAADKHELELLVSDLASTALDHSRPLWQFHLVDNYQGGSALILRIHHCYADGIALIQVLLSMTDSAAQSGARHRTRDKGYVPGGSLGWLYGRASTHIGRVVRAGEWFLEHGNQALRNPYHVLGLGKTGAEMGLALSRALALPADTRTRLKGKLGVQKRVAWAEPIPLADVKAVAKALGATVNDVLLAGVAGAIRSYLRELGDTVDGISLRATVPVNLRSVESAHTLGNRFGLVFLELPIGIEDPIERLYRVRNEMAGLKASNQAVATYGVLAALGMGPSILQEAALDFFSNKATAVMTNVPGPEHDLYLAGHRIKEQMFWVPQTGQIGMGVSVLSYSGHVQLGLVTDAKLVGEPSLITVRFENEFEKLLLATLIEPWVSETTVREGAQLIAAEIRALDK